MAAKKVYITDGGKEYTKKAWYCEIAQRAINARIAGNIELARQLEEVSEVLAVEISNEYYERQAARKAAKVA